MANAIVQQNTAATSVNSPASVTPTLAAASKPGNLLIITIIVTGTSPTITTPANWTLIASASNATFAGAVFAILSNAGGITSVAITISATNGGAVATIYEVAGTGVKADIASFINYTGTSWGGGVVTPLPTAIGELDITVIGVVATSVISTSSPGDFTTITGPTSSTVATTNAQKIDYIDLNTSTQETGPVGSVTGGSQNIAFGQVRFITTNSTLFTRGVGGAIFVGQSLNPAGPLEVPQPIAPGSFFSGTTGSF